MNEHVFEYMLMVKTCFDVPKNIKELLRFFMDYRLNKASQSPDSKEIDLEFKNKKFPLDGFKNCQNVTTVKAPGV